ncbi:MAG: WD40 repeat domain-containing protein [Campylobacterales bacterium]|nr:WD40 repeat domain-containing protein [Campylobacterales bacterium]
MPNISECHSNRSEITELKVLDNNFVAYSTKTHGIKIFSHKDCSVQLNVNMLHENFASADATAFSPNGEYLAFCVKTVIYIIHILSKTVIKIINTYKEEIEILSFDLESKYIIAGTAAGRILQYQYDGSSFLARLCSFSRTSQTQMLTQSFVSTFKFHKNRLACGSHFGDIFIVDLHSRVNKNYLTNSKARVNAICFLDEKTVISGTSDGKLFINYLDNMKESRRIDTSFTTIANIILMSNPNYAIISGNAKHVSIYDIKNNKIVQNKYIKFTEKVNDIAIVNCDTLIAVVDNSDIFRVELPSLAKLKSLIFHNILDEAFNLCEKDFSMKDTKEYKQLQKNYDKVYAQAVQALINRQKTYALQLIDMFKNVSSKKEEIALLFKAYENYPRFQSLYLEKKYPLAYILSTQFPALQHAYQYKKMEASWREAFMNAQRQILLGKDETAKSLLYEYMTVTSKRPMIKLILNHNKKFIEFLKAIEAKDFQKVNEIAKTHEDFTKIPTYKSLQNDIEYGLIEIQNYIKQGEVDLATEALAKYKDLPSIASKVSTLRENCQSMQKLINAYEINDFKSCYDILDTHKGLEFSELGMMLDKHWSKLMQSCEEFASKGNIKDIKAILGELILLNTRRDKIGDLLRVSFHTKIRMFMEKKSMKSAENTIYSYIDIFGIDTEIKLMMQFYEANTKAKLAITHNSRRDRDNWINSEIIIGS